MDMKWNGRKYEMGVWKLRFWLVGGMKVKVEGGRKKDEEGFDSRREGGYPWMRVCNLVNK